MLIIFNNLISVKQTHTFVESFEVYTNKHICYFVEQFRFCKYLRGKLD